MDHNIWNLILVTKTVIKNKPKIEDGGVVSIYKHKTMVNDIRCKGSCSRHSVETVLLLFGCGCEWHNYIFNLTFFCAYFEGVAQVLCLWKGDLGCHTVMKYFNRIVFVNVKQFAYSAYLSLWPSPLYQSALLLLSVSHMESGFPTE